ncbi:hypothetical protein KOY48_03180 [Candidatus Minimicrobia naudis]|uniref:Anticodon-binding domain-containing protein n=1 Tax=Candidatus Minimicrobia naudis TaxID=2841263 RepID=A0A8F1SB34_9BACT|nr:hypothetical protein KOY48_03180 [Candidatus Minimicrobia naudis]
MSKESLAGADDLARKLRGEGVRAELDITGRKIDNQIKAALKKQIPFAVFVGEDEIASGAYTVRNLVESDEQKVGAERNCRLLSRIVDMMAMTMLCLSSSLISVIISLYEDYCKKPIRY